MAFFFKRKPAYEMRISDWSSDVCSSDLCDAATLLRVAEAERVSLISMVGDAYDRPVIEELRRQTYDLSNLSTLGIGGAATSEECKVDILDLLPHVPIMDGYGSSEKGCMAIGARTTNTKNTGYKSGADDVARRHDHSHTTEAA